MPATEQTWRSPSLLHLAFGLTGLAMLGTTIWMLAADHAREWKKYQRTFRHVESWTLAARIQEEETLDFHVKTRELDQALEATLAELFDDKLVEKFVADAEPRANQNGYNLAAVRSANEALQQARSNDRPAAEIVELRQNLVSAISAVINRAKLDEDNSQSALKFERANLDVERSLYAIAIDEGRPVPEQARRELAVAQVEAKVLDLQDKYETAKVHRLALQDVLNEINAKEDEVRKQIQEHQAGLARLRTQLNERQITVWREALELPIIDAFGRILKVDQIWLPKLTINNNFRDVARFDRCMTCHQGIDKTAPGSATDPGYKPAHELVLTLASPAVAPAALWIDGQGEAVEEIDGQQPVKDLGNNQGIILDAEGNERTGPDGKPLRARRLPPSTRNVYGFTLAQQGLIEPGDVTVEASWPLTAAANAQLMTGDVLLKVNDARVFDRTTAESLLLGPAVNWGQPLQLTVRRGLPQPYSSHPRLDLFLGSLSPHPTGEFGCTICHDGQGSATQFKWASHTPNSPKQMEQWHEKHGWFNNHHWIFPMQPQRFVESGCLKCHHEVVELEPSEKFPDPPAAKLMAGFHLIREYGCFGCHEINGYDSPDKRRGPDMRLEPPYYAAAEQVLADPALQGKQKLEGELAEVANFAHTVVNHPELPTPRARLAELLRQDAAKAAGGGEALFTATTHRMGSIIGSHDETPGKYRKTGPSLRHIASKVELPFLYSWIKEPKNFRPSTKMPQFFGLWDHLVADEKVVDGQVVLDSHGHPVMEESRGLKVAQQFEPVEIRAISAYLLASSQPFDYLPPHEGVTAQPSVERGKLVFQTRGCLACHQHEDFPEATDTQGPNLSRLGAKLKGERGSKWLYSWVREPNRYHSRTVMPNVFLDPKTESDGSVSDPAADVTAYLLSSQDWSPETVPAVDEQALDELALEYLRGAFTRRQAEEYIATGIPKSRAAEIKGDEVELLGPIDTEKKLLYVGRRTIGRLGCAGCHDIPGFEDAKPIGTGLADWGRKEPEKLAFEQILAYLNQSLGDGHGHGLNVRDLDPDTGFFVEGLLHHERTGFLWQKLREPRSYDYKKTEGKPYIDRLRMPLFPFSEEQREQVMTFVLGLVSEAPAAEFVYQPDRRSAAIQAGRTVLTKYNCDSCHMLEQESWDFEYVPEESGLPNAFFPPPATEDFPFVLDYFSPEQLEASKKLDRRGLGHAHVVGMPNPDAVDEDDEGNKLLFFGPWKSTAVDGHAWYAGGPEMIIPEPWITQKRAPRGGAFAQLLHPVALALEQQTNPNAKGSDAWGWVPPPLMRQGSKVQTAWLHDFLLDPHPIRPAAILRMPKFNMSSDESSKLVNYFAAVDNVDFPYEFDPRTREEYLARKNEAHPGRLDQALKLITDSNYCVKCHLIGDFTPPGGKAALAPNLDQVHARFRPEFLRRWIANPKRLLPYTGMPVNFPMDQPANQELFPGSSLDQIDAVVDLLLNYETLSKSRQSYKDTIIVAPPDEQAAGND